MKTTLASLARRIETLEEHLKNLPQVKPSRFTDNGDGTVTDKEAGLVWMKQDDGKHRSWEEAKKYCEQNEAKLPGKGWRLHTVKELVSLVDYEKYDPAIDPVFTKTQSSSYWSSTSYAYFSDYAWYVDFGSGGVDWDSRGFVSCVRPVRQNYQST